MFRLTTQPSYAELFVTYHLRKPLILVIFVTLYIIDLSYYELTMCS